MSGSSRSRSQAYGSSVGPVGRSHVCGLVGATGGVGQRHAVSVIATTARVAPGRLPCVVSMRVWIDQDLCTGDGLCVDHCPDVFTQLEDGIAYVTEAGRPLNDPGGSGSLARVPRAAGAAVSSTPPRPARGSASSSRSIPPADAELDVEVDGRIAARVELAPTPRSRPHRF